jgi:predicted AlkP superfamily pyrophosphatase or phosphodiesterase
VAAVFGELENRGVVKTVYGEEQIRRMKLGGPIDYVLEAQPGCYFVPDFEGEVLAPAPETFRGAHGYHPAHPAYSSLFFAAGSGIRKGAEPASLCIVDIGPTAAALLGLQLRAAEGRVLREILDFD